MALDNTRILANPGALVYDTGDSNTRIGFRGDMVELIWSPDHLPVKPENFGNIPSDYLEEGGEVFVLVTAWQFDTEVRRALGKHMISGSDLKIGTANVGVMLSTLTSGSLTFTPDGGSKHVGFVAAKAAPVRQSELRTRFGARDVTEFLVSFACLPDAVDGTQIKITEEA